MKNSELISKLQQFPPDMEVCLYDYLKNIGEDSGEGSAAGIYTHFEVGKVENVAEAEAEEPVERSPDFIVLAFDNEDFEDPLRKCRICGCTDDDCSQCIEKTGTPCHWVEEDLCSACMPAQQKSSLLLPGKDF